MEGQGGGEAQGVADQKNHILRGVIRGRVFNQQVPEVNIRNYKKLGRFLCEKIFLYSFKGSGFNCF
jgi:hypothetical protein